MATLQQLDHLSRYDTMTGLRNRNAFNLAVDTLMQRRGAVGVVYADAAELDEAISKTDRRMYRDKVAHYEQVGKTELPRHEFYLTVKKSLQDKVNDVKIE